MSDWISVKDRLPSHTETVLVFDPEWEGQYVAEYVDFEPHWLWSPTPCGPGVTHWQPLPDPPQEDAE